MDHHRLSATSSIVAGFGQLHEITDQRADRTSPAELFNDAVRTTGSLI
jgi:hypothetical protein